MNASGRFREAGEDFQRGDFSAVSLLAGCPCPEKTLEFGPKSERHPLTAPGGGLQYSLRRIPFSEVREMTKIASLWVLLLATGLLASGCSSQKRVESTEATTKPATTEEVKTTKPQMMSSDQYEVVRGDNLWDISGKDSIYGDHWQWPLIFKANRDKIQDPDLIYPRQVFNIGRNFTEAEIQEARKDARDTPPYVPHTKPRETLPVDYF